MADKMEFKDRLKTVMELKGIRAVDIVENTSIPKGAVSYYLSGKTQPKSDRLHILAKYLNVSEAWLLGYDVQMQRTEMQKKNDNIVQVIAKLRRDPEFYEVVSVLSELPEAEYASIKQLLLALRKK